MNSVLQFHELNVDTALYRRLHRVLVEPDDGSMNASDRRQAELAVEEFERRSVALIRRVVSSNRKSSKWHSFERQ